MYLCDICSIIYGVCEIRTLIICIYEHVVCVPFLNSIMIYFLYCYGCLFDYSAGDGDKQTAGKVVDPSEHAFQSIFVLVAVFHSGPADAFAIPSFSPSSSIFAVKLPLFGGHTISSKPGRCSSKAFG